MAPLYFLVGCVLATILAYIFEIHCKNGIHLRPRTIWTGLLRRRPSIPYSSCCGTDGEHRPQISSNPRQWSLSVADAYTSDSYRTVRFGLWNLDTVVRKLSTVVISGNTAYDQGTIRTQLLSMIDMQEGMVGKIVTQSSPFPVPNKHHLVRLNFCNALQRTEI